MSALVTYMRHTSERVEAEVESLVELLRRVGEAGADTAVQVEIFDDQGRRHRLEVRYKGETSGLYL